MRTSPAGRAMITEREGCRLTAYRDTRGIWTIGVGHVDMTPPKAVAGMVITKAEADQFLAADLGQVEAVINKVTVPMTQNEFDAMASLGFNIGVGALKKSTVIKKLNLGDIKGAADAFLMWSHPSELVARRKAERLQFLTPDPAIAAARATTLAVKATATRTRAKVAGSSSATAAFAATPLAATVASQTHGHHPMLVAALGAGILVAAAIALTVSILAHRKAGVLAANAGHQADVASNAVAAA